MSAASDAKMNIDKREVHTLHSVILGCEGVFEALRWIDDGLLNGTIAEDRLRHMRGCLISGGLSLCELTGERF
jgi:hypothetical protein